jgi:hypothetical protein
MSFASQAIYPFLLLLLQSSVATPSRDLTRETVTAAAGADTLVRRQAATVLPSAPLPVAPGPVAGSRDTVRIEDVSDQSLEWWGFWSGMAALGAAIIIILQTQRSLRAATAATQEAREANRLASDALRAAIYPHMQQWLGVQTIDGSPFLVLELQNDGPLPASNVKIFVGSYLSSDHLSTEEFVERYCEPGARPESLQAGAKGEYLVEGSMGHRTLWKSRLMQPLHFDFGARLHIVIVHFADVSGRYYLWRTRYKRTPAVEPTFLVHVEIDITETDKPYELIDGRDGSPGIITTGTKEMLADTKLRDHLANHSVNWTSLKDQQPRRSIPRKE